MPGSSAADTGRMEAQDKTKTNRRHMIRFKPFTFFLFLSLLYKTMQSRGCNQFMEFLLWNLCTHQLRRTADLLPQLFVNLKVHKGFLRFPNPNQQKNLSLCAFADLFIASYDIFCQGNKLVSLHCARAEMEQRLFVRTHPYKL